jgi:hypothetical protein
MKTDRTPFQIRWRLERDKSFIRLIKTMKEKFYDKNEKIIKDTETHSSKNNP